MPRFPLDLSDSLHDATVWRRPSLAAILAGAVVALAVQFVLSLFAAYAGLERLDGEAVDLAATDAVSGVAVPALMLGIAGLCGGWVAGRLASLPGGMAGPVHGGVAWALAALLAAAASAGSLAPLSSGAFSLAGRAFEGVAPGDPPALAEAVPELAAIAGPTRVEDPLQTGLEEAVRRAREFLSTASETDRERTQAALLDTVQRLLQTEQPLQGPEAQRAMELIQQIEGGSPEQAEALLRQWADTYRQAVADARRRAEAESARAALAALIAAISLTVGGLAAFIGGWLGSPSLRTPPPS